MNFDKIALQFVSYGSIDDIRALVQIMAGRWPADRPLSEPMMVRLPTHICVTHPSCQQRIVLFIQVSTFQSLIGLFQDLIPIWFDLQSKTWLDIKVLYMIPIIVGGMLCLCKIQYRKWLLFWKHHFRYAFNLLSELPILRRHRDAV